MKENLKVAISFLILSFVTLISSVFAWVSISKRSNIGGLGGNISDYTDLVSFYVQRNSDPVPEFVEIKTITDMADVFSETKPGESYTFKIIIGNYSTKSFDFFANLTEIKNETQYGGNALYDLRDVFYIDDGEVIINVYNNEILQSSTSVEIEPNDNTPVTKHDQLLNDYRLNNLMTDGTNNIALFTPITVNPLEDVEIIFTLIYDVTTENINYQNNRLTIDGIYMYGQ